MTNTGLMIDIVCAPERGELADQIGLLVVMLGRTEPVDAVWTAFLANLQHGVADLVDRVFPADLLPLSGNLLHRVFQPALTMAVLAHRGALGAVGAKIERAVETGLLADPDAIDDFGLDRAADRTMRADRALHFDLADGRRRRRFGPSHHSTGKTGDGGNASGGHT